MLAETIIVETPPLYSCYGRVGQRVCVPVTGNHARRVLHGALTIESGAVLVWITEEWVQETHHAFRRLIRAHWRGWHIVLFEDRGSPHLAEESVEVAQALKIEVRFLPRATPELNVMDRLWRHTKGYVLADRPTWSIDASADAVCQYILGLRPYERLQKAGVFSGNFWLTT